MGVAGSPKSAVRAGSLASAEKVSAPTKRVASGVRTGATWKRRSRSRRRTSTDLYAAMPPATPRTMRGVDDSGVAEGIGEGVQVVGGVLACLLIRLRLQPLGLELLGGRSVELQLVLVELLEGEGERLVRQRGHLGRDERAVARAQAVVVLVDLARADGRHRDEGELGVADLGEEVLDGRVDERGAFCHGLVPFRGGETLPAKSFQYREDLPGRSPEVVVDDLVGPQGPRARQFHRGRGEAARHVVLVVAPRAQARLELDVRRGQDQEDGGAGVARAYLLGALDLDLEQDVGVARRVGHRRAVEMSLELGPFEEAALARGGLEVAPLDEDVLAAVLVGAPRTRRPAPREPQARIGRHQAPRQRSLADPARADQHDDERLSGQGPGRAPRAAWVPGRAPGGSWRWRREP